MRGGSFRAGLIGVIGEDFGFSWTDFLGVICVAGLLGDGSLLAVLVVVVGRNVPFVDVALVSLVANGVAVDLVEVGVANGSTGSFG